MKYRVTTEHIVEASSKGDAYAKLMRSRVQNEFILKALTKTKGPLLIDIANELDYKELKRLLYKYPEYASRLPKPIKERLNPSLLKQLIKHAAKVALMVGVMPGAMVDTKKLMKESTERVVKQMITRKIK